MIQIVLSTSDVNPVFVADYQEWMNTLYLLMMGEITVRVPVKRPSGKKYDAVQVKTKNNRE